MVARIAIRMVQAVKLAGMSRRYQACWATWPGRPCSNLGRTSQATRIAHLRLLHPCKIQLCPLSLGPHSVVQQHASDAAPRRNTLPPFSNGLGNRLTEGEMLNQLQNTYTPPELPEFIQNLLQAMDAAVPKPAQPPAVASRLLRQEPR